MGPHTASPLNGLYLRLSGEAIADKSIFKGKRRTYFKNNPLCW